MVAVLYNEILYFNLFIHFWKSTESIGHLDIVKIFFSKNFLLIKVEKSSKTSPSNFENYKILVHFKYSFIPFNCPKV